MKKLNFNFFADFSKNLVSLMETVNGDGIFTNSISKLSYSIGLVEDGSSALASAVFLDLQKNILKLVEDYNDEIYEDITNQISILACAAYIVEYGVITFSDLRYIEYFSNEDLQVIANLLGSSIIYDTNEFIANVEYLEDCSITEPSI